MVIRDIDPARFAAIVQANPVILPDDDRLLLARAGRLAQFWSPFDHVPKAARLVCVGITPGHEQAGNALQAFAQALRQGRPLADALRYAKLVGSFSGALRSNLVDMLNAIGIQRVLGVPGCAALFDPAHELVHFTSALRYPVFVDGANYSGSPDLLRTPLLRGIVETYLAAEARALPEAVWLPLGPKPAAALRHLVTQGVLPADRVLQGLPHPSGANNERIHYFLGRKARAALSARTRPDTIELARDQLLAQVARLRSV